MGEGLSRFESVVEEQIREAQERGEFDDLPGKGKPLPGLEDADDEEWWVRRYISREGLSSEALLPESLLLRKELQRLDETVAGLPTEQAVREHVEELNRQIRRARIMPSGPPVVLRLARVDDVLARWRESRPNPRPSSTPAPEAAPSGMGAGRPARSSRWWRRPGGKAGRAR
jgi:hypothetical protein